MSLTDKRQNFFSSHFERASSYADHLAGGSAHQQERWKASYESAALSKEQEKLLQGFHRKMNVLILSGVWCGDCSRQCPILKRFEEANPAQITLRFADNQEFPDLQEELRIHGGARVPVAVFLSEDFFEVSRFGDRTLSVYRRKAERELGTACDPGLLQPGVSERQQEILEWLSEFERVQLLLQLSPFLRERYGR